VSDQTYKDLRSLAKRLRDELDKKEFILLYAYNGVGKTRLSMEFKELGKKYDDEGKATRRDTLYFNAYTEDLFTWDNDLDNDSERVLQINKDSAFFSDFGAHPMESQIRLFLDPFYDFDFSIDYHKGEISFFRYERKKREDGSHETIRHDNIKLSRGEENIFIWCYFLSVVQLVIDDQEAYGWVRYLYIDDPISSLDDQNAVAVATHLARMLNNPESRLKTVISTHHTLFFNVLYNELDCKRGRRGSGKGFFLTRDRSSSGYRLQDTSETPRFYHLAALVELHKAVESGKLYTYHFNVLRTILEKTASFHGYKNFSACIRQDKDDQDIDDLDDKQYTRLINILNHGNYSLYEPPEMPEKYKDDFRKILKHFTKRFLFNKELFSSEASKKENSNK